MIHAGLPCFRRSKEFPKLTSVVVAGRVGREENGGCFESLVGAAQLGDLTPQLADLRRFLGRDSRLGRRH